MKLASEAAETSNSRATSQSGHLGYRPDIDGLRAIAVISVVGYHLFPAFVPGGFVGVDMFFVISGYLISTIVISEVTHQSFSFTIFYARRAKRILPALISVSSVAMLFYSHAFFSTQILSAYQSLIASFLFSANLYFNATTGYFDPAVNELPFLHYWSLGIEEQYYLFFPIIALAVCQIRKLPQAGIYVAITLVSVVGSEAVLRYNPSAAYYLIPWRAWELMIGTLTYYAIEYTVIKNPKISAVLFWLGIGLIGYSLYSLNASSSFPGVNALPACLGTAFVIVSGARFQGLGNVILGFGPINAIGRISYSLYLVHWPVYIILSTAYPDGRGFGTPFIMLLLALVFAAANYALVEQPFRSARFSSRHVVVVSASALVLVLILCESGVVYYQAKVEHARHPGIGYLSPNNYECQSATGRSRNCPAT